MRIIYKITRRLLSFPFVLGIMLVHSIITSIGRAILFIFYGGEFIPYSLNQQRTIKDVFDKLNEVLETPEFIEESKNENN